MNSTRRSFVLRYVLTALVIFALFGVGHFLSRSEFKKLEHSIRFSEDWKDIEISARRLRRDPKAINEAFADFNIWGGKTRFVSSWILMTTELQNEVDPRLKSVMESSKVPIEKRLEAAKIFWIRTGQTSSIWNLFHLTGSPDGIPTKIGRRYLRDCFRDPEIRRSFDVPEAVPLPQTQAEVQEFIERPNALALRIQAENIPLR